jgi:hypothetical protein
VMVGYLAMLAIGPNLLHKALIEFRWLSNIFYGWWVSAS